MEENCEQNNEITSIRIVSVDNYMSYPIAELDQFYSDFRGSEIKQVPIIRIFGSDLSGKKVCLHVHGVFPYMYVPFDGDSDESDRITYQIASSLDKAINISLGQSTATVQHVFKVTLVKGTPFYGYHATEHTFLKIYFYNPYFIKRAASLFHNGVILGKIFQSYESHIPFILQFFIDYNLYGMSFLHVPSDTIRYRRSDSGLIGDVNPAKLLDPKIVRLSVSELEFDIVSTNILNRLANDTRLKSEHINPGIASIWNDERSRRKQMNSDSVPSVELPLSQNRPGVFVTESDLFYREALASKLQNKNFNDTVLHETLLSNTVSEKPNKIFNLSALLNNSVYPAQFSQDAKNLINASYIENHSSRSGPIENEQIRHSKDYNSSINESIVLSLSKPNLDRNISLNAEDYDLLEIMRLLEENEDKEVENDSLLAPLTQSKTILSQTINLSQSENQKLNKSIVNIISDCVSDKEIVEKEFDLSHEFSDSDDDLLNDLSIVFEHTEISDKLDKCKEKEDLWHNSFWDNVKLPQFDGANDLNSASKRTQKRRSNGLKSPAGKMSKYEVLNITESSRKHSNNKSNEGTGNNNVETIQISDILSDIEDVPFGKENSSQQGNNSKNKTKNGTPNKRPKRMRKKLDFIIIGDEDEQQLDQNNRRLMRSHKSVNQIKIDLSSRSIRSLNRNNKLQINLTSSDDNVCPIQNIDNFPPLMKCHVVIEKCNIEEINQISLPRQIETITENLDLTSSPTDNETVKLNVSPSQKESTKDELIPSQITNKDEEIILTSSQTESEEEGLQMAPEIFLNNLPIIKLTKLTESDIEELKNSIRVTKVEEKKARPWSPSDIARLYDKKNNFYPEPGPSTVNYYHNIYIPGYYKPLTPPPNKSPTPTKENDVDQIQDLINNISDTSDNSNDENIHSFYNKSMFLDSPEPQIQSSDEIIERLDELIKITTTKLPPTYDDAIKSSLYEQSKNLYQEPFYSNPDDVTGKKEVGHTILRINDKSVNSLEHFKSLLTERNSLNDWRRDVVTEMFGGKLNEVWKLNSDNDNTSETIPKNSNTIREFLATEEIVEIFPHFSPPKRRDAIKWLKAEEKKVKDKIPIEPVFPKVILIDDDDSNDNDILAISSVVSHIKEQPIKASNKTIRFESPTSRKYSQSLKKKSQSNLSIQKNCKQIMKKNPRKSIEGIIDICDLTVIDSTFVEIGNKSPQSSYSDKTIESTSSACNHNLVTSKKILDRIKNINDNDSDLDRSSDLTGTTLNNTYGFKMDLESYQNANANADFNYLTILSIEIHVQTRIDLNPDPDYDPVSTIFYSIQNNVPVDYHQPTSKKGIFVLDTLNIDGKNPLLKKSSVEIEITYVNTEKELFNKLYELIKFWDPDIFVGYEIELASWGYIIQRGYIIEMNLPVMFSRIPSAKIDLSIKANDETEETGDYVAELKIPGRILMDVWRLLRHEIALTSYTFENVLYHILHRRTALHSFKELTRMWNHSQTRWIVIDYYLERTKGSLELLDQLDLIGRTCELAKLFGIQFFEVMSRGSQFRVESMMLRMAKPRNFIPVSPSVQQRAHMQAPEYLALILEPQSRFYIDPLIVLDFQSLYPSMMIAYNYCFSTCLGRVEHLGESDAFEFGASQLKVPPKLLKNLVKRNLITISPCGVVFVKSKVREGTLPRMLKEILDTRLMVKQSMKIHKGNTLLQRVLHSRQLGLKLIANVTYGYTAANFSGRMPNVEVADSVVSKGRETLERAINMVEANKKWRAKVVYGDTDSLFVLVPGRTKDEAFRIGAEIADAVTNDNPQPVKLKLEKVYQPSILQTKKRYVGFMYETPDQKEPVYEAKGIETVRRDSCPAVPKVLEKTIRLLFETRDVSLIKRYLSRQFTKIINGKVNLQDLIFAKEFRGITGYKPGACVPSLELARKWQITDKRAVPRRGERVPYIITSGPPGLPLIRLVRSPHELLANDGLKINSMYYITKVLIPPLNRCLLLIGVDANDWVADLPRKIQINQAPMFKCATKLDNNAKKSTISQYFSTTNCITDCGRQTQNGICVDCLKDKQKSSIHLNDKISKLDRKLAIVSKICQSCHGRLTNINCISLDCPVLFKLCKTKREHNQIEHIREILINNFQ